MSLKDLINRIRGKRERESNLVAHARRELALLRSGKPDEMQDEMDRCVLQIIRVFADQGHSGFSASYLTSVVEKLMRFEPIAPLTGADDEWMETGVGVYQNIRCSHVFKDADGTAYDIDGIIWREPSGACFTNFESRVPVTFPYAPNREYRDVPAEAA